jgi:hypothetical protein
MSKPDRFIIDLTASCACGTIEVTVNGPVLSMLQCSCLDCQRASGTAHTSVVIVPAQALNIAGETNLFGRPSDSGATFTRHFCPHCGTPIYGQSSRAEALRMLPVGFFAGQNSWFAPSQLIFARSQPIWDLVADHIPKHPTYRDVGTP